MGDNKNQQTGIYVDAPDKPFLDEFAAAATTIFMQANMYHMDQETVRHTISEMAKHSLPDNIISGCSVSMEKKVEVRD